MNRAKSLLPALLLAVALSACVPLSGPPATGSPTAAAPKSAAAPDLTPCPESYGRSLLSGTERAAYDRLRDAALSGAAEAELPRLEEDALFRVLTYLRRDEPRLDWLAPAYSFAQRDSSTQVRLAYALPPGEIAARTSRLADAAAPLLDGLSDGLPEFDRAVLLHDRLTELLRYDLAAPRKNELAGALLDGRATCEGYAKAYQFLLQKAGIQALLVYGDAGEPHAWNIVRLDGDYYLCDITWDDAPLAEGGEFVSHEYLFWDDASFAASHTPSPDGSVNVPLPRCDSLEQNYFCKTGSLLQSADPGEAEAVFARALDRAAAYGYAAVQAGFASPAVADAVEAEIRRDGALDRFVRDAAARKGLAVRGRAFSETRTALSYLVETARAEPAHSEKNKKETNSLCADLSALPGTAPTGRASCGP